MWNPFLLMKSKRAEWQKYIVFAVTLPIGILLLLKILAATVPEAQAAGNELNATGVPLGSLFTGQGVLFIVLMVAAFAIVVVGATKYFHFGGKYK
jgi:hypothetical protein